MWDFEHPPLDDALKKRYRIDRMTPSECAARLADGRADIGLIPIASLATAPGLQILPGCTIASKGRVRSLILVHRASRPLRSCVRLRLMLPAEQRLPMRASCSTSGAMQRFRLCPW